MHQNRHCVQHFRQNDGKTICGGLKFSTVFQQCCNNLLDNQITVLHFLEWTQDGEYCYSDIKVWWFVEQFTSCVSSVLHSSEKSFRKFWKVETTSNTHSCRLQTSMWGYHFHFNSTWRKPRVTANSPNSPACVSTKSTSESAPKKFPLRLDKEFTLLSSPNRRERKKKTCCLSHNMSLRQTERKLTI